MGGPILLEPYFLISPDFDFDDDDDEDDEDFDFDEGDATKELLSLWSFSLSQMFPYTSHKPATKRVAPSTFFT